MDSRCCQAESSWVKLSQASIVSIFAGDVQLSPWSFTQRKHDLLRLLHIAGSWGCGLGFGFSGSFLKPEQTGMSVKLKAKISSTPLGTTLETTLYSHVMCFDFHETWQNCTIALAIQNRPTWHWYKHTSMHHHITSQNRNALHYTVLHYITWPYQFYIVAIQLPYQPVRCRVIC